jgi:hypothetical protein
MAEADIVRYHMLAALTARIAHAAAEVEAAHGPTLSNWQASTAPSKLTGVDAAVPHTEPRPSLKHLLTKTRSHR